MCIIAGSVNTSEF